MVSSSWIDPSPPGAAELLERSLRADARASNAYALLDMAFDPELIRRLQKLASPNRMESLYAGAYDGPDLDTVAPQLISLPADDENRLPMLQRLLKATDGRPMLSFVTTELSTTEFKAHLQHQIEATTPDGKEWMLRFADTRTLHALLSVFSTDQRKRFLAGIDQWIYFDRAGQLVAVPGGPGNAASETSPYALAADQAARLKSLALPDALLFNIAKRPDLFGRLQGRLSVAHACIEAALAKLQQPSELHDATLYSAVLAALSEHQLIAETAT
ncbi:MAG: DUF4123 domain-containing protein [Variovorax sp.]|nr:MAG: DUF4123 domain-containing protein [Variovorax sp.]